MFRLRVPALLLLLSCVYFLNCKRPEGEPAKHDAVPSIPVPQWESLRSGELFLKMAGTENGDFLLLHLSDAAQIAQAAQNPNISVAILGIGRPIYRYDSARNALYSVSPESWDNNPAPVLPCYKQDRIPQVGAFTHDYSTYTLAYKGHALNTVGKSVLTSVKSPDGNYVAALSAEGSPEKGFLPFSAHTVSGKRFHQVFRFADGSEAGLAVILNDTTEQDDLLACWSPDSNHIVYIDGPCRHLWIVQFQPKE